MDGFDFVTKSTLLWIGNISVTVLGIFSFYILTNFLAPVEYANYSLVLSIIAMVSLALYGIISDAMVRFSLENKNEVLYYGLKLKFILGLAAFLFFIIFADVIASIYNRPIASIIRIASFAFLFTPFIEALKASSVGLKKVTSFNLVSVIYQFSLDAIE